MSTSSTFQVGEKYTLAWKMPHRLECEIIELARDGVIVEAMHRCPISCYLMQMRRTLPIEGRMTYRYKDFAQLFVRIPEGSIPLAGGVS
jgi:hypothetical protein